MTPSEWTVLGLVGWTLTLLVMLAALRTRAVMTGARQANSFSAAGDDVEGFARRLTRAHANCYENAPLAAALLVYAIATGQGALTDGLAYLFLAARILQSLVHLASTTNPAVTLRFGFFLVQLVILFYWLAALAKFI